MRPRRDRRSGREAVRAVAEEAKKDKERRWSGRPEADLRTGERHADGRQTSNQKECTGTWKRAKLTTYSLTFSLL